MRYHLDTDFLVFALSTAGAERRRLRALDAVLLTRNARDFAGIPDLRVEAAGPRVT